MAAIASGIYIMSSRVRGARDKARKPQASRVDAKALKIIIAKELARRFCNAVDRVRALDRYLRRARARGRWAEGSDRAWKEHPAIVLARRLEHIVEAAHVQGPRGLR